MKALIDLAMSPPPEHARHWTLKALAEATGDMVVSTVHNILRLHGLRPHQVKTFKVSRDPGFEIKVRDVVGLYIDSPDHAVVLSVDEKTQIQVLGRTQKPLPMKPGHAETGTHDCKRKGMHERLGRFGGRDRGRMHAEEAGKRHGRIEQRHCTAVDISGPEWNGFCPLNGRRQAFRVIRNREVVRTGETGIETVHGLTSLGPDQAGAREIAGHVRSHWQIGTRLHHVRDFTHDEDRCRAHAGNVPQNLSAISDMAISLIRLDGRFEHVPPANRHFAARPLAGPQGAMGPARLRRRIRAGIAAGRHDSSADCPDMIAG